MIVLCASLLNTLKPQSNTGGNFSTEMCQMNPVLFIFGLSGSSTKGVCEPGVKRQRVSPSACSEKRAKLTQLSTTEAPRGVGVPRCVTFVFEAGIDSCIPILFLNCQTKHIFACNFYMRLTECSLMS